MMAPLSDTTGPLRRARSASVLAHALIACAATGCYASHERLGDAPRADAGAPVTRDASSPADFGQDAAPCAWSSRAPWALTEPPGDHRADDVVAVPEGFLVAFASSNDPPREPGRFLQRVGLDGPLAARQTIFAPTSGPFVGGVGLAASDSAVLAATWDRDGCTTRLLSLDGTPRAGAVRLPRRSCVAPMAVAGGFALLDRPGDLPARLFGVGPRGDAIGAESQPLDVLDGAFFWARARHADGTLLLVGMERGVEPARALAQRMTEGGAPLDPVAELPAFGAANRVRAAPTSEGALLAWLEAPSGDASSQERELRVFPVDASGCALAAPARVSGGVAYRDGGISLARAQNGVLAAYVESQPGDRSGRATSLVVLHLSERGEPLARLVVDAGEFVRAPILRVRGRETLVAYGAHAEGAIAHQVRIAGLVCDMRP